MSKLHKLVWMLFVTLMCVGCDQITKSIAQDTLKTEPTRSYLADTFRLQYAENTGAFLSLGSSLSKTMRTLLFTVLSGALLFGLIFYILLNREIDLSQTIGLSAILGGGLSNLADRIVNDGRVVDFMNMGIGSLRTGIFNVADVAIMAGMAFVLLMNIHWHRKDVDRPAPDAGSVGSKETS
jgi:signal peptidase II